MKWFRLYTEARTDAKLALLTDAEFRVWFKLLCYAAEQEPRGHLNGVPEGKLAAEVARGKGALLNRTLDKLQELQVIERTAKDLRFIHFADRQYERPSERPAAVAARVSKHRRNVKRRETTVKRDVTT